jgi:hypothetical protein
MFNSIMVTAMLLGLLCSLSTRVHAQDSLLSKSDLICLDPSSLAAHKDRIRAHDPALLPAYDELLKDADKLLEYAPVSVIQKTAIPPSGNKHDYMSIAPYFWPDPSKPGGLPYVNRDGVVNPEVRNYPDKINMTALCGNLYILALAYYFSDDEKYAGHAGKLAEVWFVDPATRMNPNLNYGQAVKGVTEGRAAGLIDSRQFIWALDGIGLLKHSTHWTVTDQRSVQEWFRAFLNWLQTSRIGREEMNAKNNHGVWYDAQCLSMALFIDSTDLANRIVQRAMGRLDKQMDPSGLFPLELTRTTSLHYSVFIMNAFYVIAQLSERTGTNLWTTKTESGKSLQQAFEAIRPFITKEKAWTGPQIHEFNRLNAVPLLLRSADHFNCRSCMDDVRHIEGGGFEKLLFNLL